jgi:hypothetical protein
MVLASNLGDYRIGEVRWYYEHSSRARMETKKGQKRTTEDMKN